MKAPNRPDRRPENNPARDSECQYPRQLIERLIATLFELSEIELAAFFEGYGGVLMDRSTRGWFENLYEFF